MGGFTPGGRCSCRGGILSPGVKPETSETFASPAADGTPRRDEVSCAGVGVVELAAGPSHAAK